MANLPNLILIDGHWWSIDSATRFYGAGYVKERLGIPHSTPDKQVSDNVRYSTCQYCGEPYARNCGLPVKCGGCAKVNV